MGAADTDTTSLYKADQKMSVKVIVYLRSGIQLEVDDPCDKDLARLERIWAAPWWAPWMWFRRLRLRCTESKRNIAWRKYQTDSVDILR